MLGSIGRCKSRMGDVQKGMGWRTLRVSAPLASLSIFGDLTCLRDGPFKKWWVWWGGGREGREIFSLQDHIFFLCDKHEYFYSGAEIFSCFVVVVVVFWKYTNHFLDFFYTNRVLKITVYMTISFSNTNTCDKKWYATLIILFGYVTRRRDGNFNDPTPLSLHSNTTALKHGIRKRKQNTEYGIRERRFQAINLKKIYISNDNKINKLIKKDTNE